MKRFLFLLLPVIFALSANAQDIHFSQFYNSPLTLNPALTGLMDGSLRAGVLYRNQWRSITTAFVTTAGYFDMPITKRLKHGDQVGVGLLLFDDKTGTAGLNTFTAVASAAYHKTLGVNHTHVLSLGVQLGFTQTRIDLSKAIFQDQVDPNTLTPTSNSSSEAGNISSKIYEEFNLGIGYSFKFGKDKRDKLYLGGAFFHITQPNQSVYSEEASKLPIKEVAHAGMEIAVAGNISLLPSFVFFNQAGNQETDLGLGVRYAFTEDISAVLGLYYRVKDAVIPMLGLAIKGVNFGFSYDVTASNLSTASSNRSAFELSLIYILPYKKVPNVKSVIYSPRF